MKLFCRFAGLIDMLLFHNIIWIKWIPIILCSIGCLTIVPARSSSALSPSKTIYPAGTEYLSPNFIPRRLLMWLRIQLKGKKQPFWNRINQFCLRWPRKKSLLRGWRKPPSEKGKSHIRSMVKFCISQLNSHLITPRKNKSPSSDRPP